MSHFSVLVIGEDVEGQLQPYHEFECTGTDDEYVLDIDMTDEWRAEYEDTEPHHRAVGADEDAEYTLSHKEKYGDFETFLREWHGIKLDGEYSVKQGDRYYDRTNPNCKWDWYVIGGRWRGYFKMKDGLDLSAAELGESGTFGNEPKHDADRIRKGDIDFDGMRNEAEEKARDTYQSMEEATKDIETPGMCWKEFCDKMGEDAIETARSFFNAHPWVKAIHSSSLGDGYMMGCPVERFCVNNGGKETFLKRARDGAISTFAVVKDGKWYAQGDMGWWASVSNEKEDGVWEKEFAKLLDDISDDTMLTLVDCHGA